MTPDQQALVELADRILRGRTSPDQLAAVEVSDGRVDDRLWAELAAAGLVGIAVPEQYGGAGLGLTELCLVLEQQGRRLAPLPLWETALLGGLAVASFGSATQRSRWLPGLAAGTVRLTAAFDTSLQVTGGRLTGTAALVPHGYGADALVVAAPAGLWLVPADEVVLTPVVTTSHALAADVRFQDAAAEPLGDETATGWLADRARVGLAALQLGVVAEGIGEAAAYVSGREQFGRPLATFQAVTQQLGDAYCDVQAMRATLWQAVWELEQGTNSPASVDVAAWWAADAGVRVQHAVQHLHGGLGADTTYPVHRRLLWSLQIDALLGGASRQLAGLGAKVVVGPGFR